MLIIHVSKTLQYKDFSLYQNKQKIQGSLTNDLSWTTKTFLKRKVYIFQSLLRKEGSIGFVLHHPTLSTTSSEQIKQTLNILTH
jgi:hypothetical protein